MRLKNWKKCRFLAERLDGRTIMRIQHVFAVHDSINNSICAGTVSEHFRFHEIWMARHVLFDLVTAFQLKIWFGATGIYHHCCVKNGLVSCIDYNMVFNTVLVDAWKLYAFFYDYLWFAIHYQHSIQTRLMANNYISCGDFTLCPEFVHSVEKL